MLDYNKQDVIEMGDALDKLVNALTGDGVGQDDFDEMIGMFTATAKAVNEAKAVPEAFGCHLGGRFLEKQGDKFLAKAQAAAQTDTATE